MKTRARHTILYSLQIFLMIFWLYVALDKLWELKAFHVSLLRQPFPNWWADILYWALPMTELGIALLFVAGSTFSVIQRSKATSESGKRRSTSQKNPRHPEELGDVRIWGFSRSIAFLLSALLLLIFTIYIALGVAGFYAKKPCGCASVFRGLSWEWHLLVNIVLLGLSTLGWYLSGPTNPIDTDVRYKKTIQLFSAFLMLAAVPVYDIVLVALKRFPRKFALFPGRPVPV